MSFEFKELEKIGVNDYQKAALRTKNTKLSPFEQLQNGVMGLNGEAGELSDYLKKIMFQGHKMNREVLIKELGDVAWYLAITADALGCDLESIMKMNIEKLKARYPDGFDSEKSVYRKE